MVEIPICYIWTIKNKIKIMEAIKNKVFYRIYKMVFNCKNELQINTIKNYVIQAHKMNYISEKEKDIFIDLLNTEINKTLNKIDLLYKLDKKY
jgi:hypothetical protein